MMIAVTPLTTEYDRASVSSCQCLSEAISAHPPHMSINGAPLWYTAKAAPRSNPLSTFFLEGMTIMYHICRNQNVIDACN